MVLYGETRSGQGYKARYGNSILVENSSKPGTLRFPGRTAPVVFERGGSMPNYRREYLTRVARLVSLFACIYPLRDAVWKKYFDEYCFETIQKEKKRCVCETNICPNTVTGWLFVSMRNNEVDRSISRFDKLPTHGKYFKSGFCRIDWSSFDWMAIVRNEHQSKHTRDRMRGYISRCIFVVRKSRPILNNIFYEYAWIRVNGSGIIDLLSTSGSVTFYSLN